MNSLHFGTFNCNGLVNNTQHSILEFCNAFNINILFLQETYVYSQNQINRINNTLHCDSFWSFGKINSRGVGILIFDNNIKALHHEFDLHDRFLCMDVQYFTHTLRLINIYSPNNVVERKNFFSSLDKYLCRPNVILGGDFNCIHYLSLDKVGGNPLFGTAGRNELVYRFSYVYF